jgi:hypothetical protein
MHCTSLFLILVSVLSHIVGLRLPHLVSELGGVPSARRNGVDVLDVHGVNLLERAVLGLDQEEEDDDDEGGTASGENEAVEVVDLVGDESSAKSHPLVRCRDCIAR